MKDNNTYQNKYTIFNDKKLENKLISEYSGRLLYIYDIKSGNISWSGSIQKITGMTEEEFFNVSIDGWEALIHPEDRARVSEDLNYALENQSTFNSEYRLKIKDGNYVLIEDEGNFYTSNNGDLQLIGAMKDITKRKIAEEVILAQSKLIDIISTSHNLEVVFDYICSKIDEIFYKKYTCSIITFDNKNNKVQNYYSNVFTKETLKEFENKSITSGNGSYEEAYKLGQVVIVTDITKSNLYSNVKNIYILENLRSCITYPVFDSLGKCFATFSIYKNNLIPFNEFDLQYIDKFLNLIRIAIENKTKFNEKQQLVNIIEKANNLIIIFNENNKITWINDSVNKLTGYSDNELIGIDIIDFPNIKKNNPIVIDSIIDAINNKTNYEAKLFNYSKNGKHYWVEINGTPIFDDNLVYKGYVQIENDITLRKDSEQKLIENEHLLSSITSNISEGIYRSNLDNNVVYCNNAFARLFGYTGVDEVLVTDFPILFSSVKDKEIIRLKLERDKRLSNEEVLFKRKDESTFWGLLNCRNVRDDNGEMFYDGVVKDISYKKESEVKLKSYNFQLENIMSALNVSSYVTMTDLNGNIIFVNDKFCEISGYDREFLIGKNHNINKSDLHDDAFWKEMWETISDGNPWRGEIRNKNKNGDFYWVDTVINPLKNENDEIYRYLAIRNDITARKIAEEEIIRLNESLEEKVVERTSLLNDALEEVRLLNATLYEANQNLTNMNDEKSEFMAIVAHDLKNPIQGIMFAAELIKTHIEKVSKQQIIYNMDFIEKTATRMRDIINNFLSVSAIDIGILTLEYEYLNINDIINELINHYIPIAQKKNVTIKYVSIDVYSKIDKSALTQICDNIISNAIKFSPYDKKIEITLEAVNDRYYIYVKDEGPGISHEDRKKLFKKYAKLSAKPTGGEHSTGLGLSIVKKLVEFMNGKIDCFSEYGNGATFIIEIPIKF